MKKQIDSALNKLQHLRNNPHWQLLIFLLASWVAVEVPLAYVRQQTLIVSWQLLLDALISGIFTIDLIAHSKHKDQHNLHYLIHKNERKTLPKAIRTPLDIATCIPFDIIFWVLALQTDGPFLKALSLIKLVRVFKVYFVFSSISILPRIVKVVTVLTSIVVAIHWIACAWMNFRAPENNLDFITQYNLAIYWTVSTLTTIGYGDVTPLTNIGRLFTIFVMFLGVGVYGLVIGNISKITLSSFRHKEKMREKMQDLSLLMRHYNVPKKVQREVFSYYHNLSRQRFTDNDYRILSELPHNLKREMEVYMVVGLISNIPLFEGLTPLALKRVICCLKQEFFSPGELIINRGGIGDKMFIISNGIVEVLNDKQEVINTLKSGQFFGEIALMMNIEREANVQAKSYCDIYTFDKKDFIELTVKYPRLEKNIGRLTIKRKTYKKAS